VRRSKNAEFALEGAEADHN